MISRQGTTNPWGEGRTPAPPTRRSPDRRLDQAAGAADATHEPRSIDRVGWGSQEVSCDPSSPGYAGGTPASELRRHDHHDVSQGRRAIRAVFQVPPGPPESHASAHVPGVFVARAQVDAAHGTPPRGGITFLLREDAEAPVSARR